MLRRRGIPDPQRHPRHQWHPPLPAKHEAVLGSLIDDLVHRAQGEINHTHFDHGSQAGQRHANPRPHDRRLADRGIDDSLGAKTRLQPSILTENSAAPDILPQHHDVRIRFHLGSKRSHCSLRITHHRHCPSPLL